MFENTCIPDLCGWLALCLSKSLTPMTSQKVERTISHAASQQRRCLSMLESLEGEGKLSFEAFVSLVQ